MQGGFLSSIDNEVFGESLRSTLWCPEPMDNEGSDVKQEVQHITIFDYVFFPFFA
ncbi:MAG: hypothetical protein K0Q78_2221 [Cellvibrio sp.]|jgi:hypothetical protein|nr:hypothetical protein [Cellvibrio sp.]